MESSHLEESSNLIHDRLEIMRERDELLERMRTYDLEVATTRGDARGLREKNLSLSDKLEKKEEELTDSMNSLAMVRKELSLLREGKFSSDVDAVLDFERRIAVIEVEYQKARRETQREAEEQAHKSFEYNQNERVRHFFFHFFFSPSSLCVCCTLWSRQPIFFSSTLDSLACELCSKFFIKKGLHAEGDGNHSQRACGGN